MKVYKVEIGTQVKKDIKKLKLSRLQIVKLEQKIYEIARNPLPKIEGGYGEPLKGSLKGLMKFRFDKDYRVVYQLVEIDGVMRVIIIGLRSDSEVYKKAQFRMD